MASSPFASQHKVPESDLSFNDQDLVTIEMSENPTSLSDHDQDDDSLLSGPSSAQPHQNVDSHLYGDSTDVPPVSYVDVDNTGPSASSRRKTQMIWSILYYFSVVSLFILSLVLTIILMIIMYDEAAPYRAEYTTVETPSNLLSNSGFTSNGINYYMYRNPIKKGHFCSYLRVKTGSIDETNSELGIAHMLEHMAFDASADFPGRGGVWNETMKIGAKVNAFTSFRNTVYMLWDVPIENFGKAMKVHRNQVFQASYVQQYVSDEQGAVKGEARLRNSSFSQAFNDILGNHFNNLIANRDPIGTPNQINYTTSMLNSFHNKWYQPQRMDLFLVGDFDEADLDDPAASTQIKQHSVAKSYVDELESIFANIEDNEPAKHEPIENPDPLHKILKVEIDGINGVSINLITTEPAIPRPWMYNTYRRTVDDTIFSFLFTANCLARLHHAYPEERGLSPISDSDESANAFSDFTANRFIGALIDNSFSLDSRLHLLSINSPGDSQRTTWEKDLKIALFELRRMATYGPDPTLVTGLLFAAELMTSSMAGSQDWTDSADLINQFLGDLDYNSVFHAMSDYKEILGQYNHLGFVDSMVRNIQVQAQWYWRSILEVAGLATFEKQNIPGSSEDKTIDERYANNQFYFGLAKPVASLSIITGRSYPINTTERELNPQQDISPNQATVTIDAVKSVIQQVATANNPLNTVPLLTLLADYSLSSFVALEQLPLSGFADQELMGKPNDWVYVSSQSSHNTGRFQFELSNKIRVNTKPTFFDNPWNAKSNSDVSSQKTLPRGPPGSLIIQMVAMGGWETLPPELHGACHVINSQHADGYSIIYDSPGYLSNSAEKDHVVDFDKSTLYAFDTVHGLEARLECHAEELILTIQVHGPCNSYPQESAFSEENMKEECNPEDFNYRSAAELLRLHMAPRYSDRSIRLAYDDFVRSETHFHNTRDPFAILFRVGLFSVFEQAYNDTRTHFPTPAQVRKLDPIAMQRFVRETFAPNSDPTKHNVEINVVGDYDETKLLNALNDVLGTVPPLPSNYQRTSYDPYSSVDVGNFTRAYPSNTNTSESFVIQHDCQLPNWAPGRAYAALIAPGLGWHNVSDEVYLWENTFKMHMFKKIRQDGSYSYFAISFSIFSKLFPNWGLHLSIWGPSVEELAASFADAQTAFNTSVSNELVNDELALLTSIGGANLQTLEPWLHILRGSGISPPSSWAASSVTWTKQFLKDNKLDVIKHISTINKTDLSTVLTRSLGDKTDSETWIKVSVETIPVDQNPSNNCLVEPIYNQI